MFYICVSQVDPSVKPPNRIALYLVLQDLVKDEITAAECAKVSRDEVTMVIIFLKTHLHQGFKVYSDRAGASLKENPVNYSDPSFMDQTCVVKFGSTELD